MATPPGLHGQGEGNQVLPGGPQRLGFLNDPCGASTLSTSVKGPY